MDTSLRDKRIINIEKKLKHNQVIYLMKSLKYTSKLLKENPVSIDLHKNTFISSYLIIYITSYLNLNDIIDLNVIINLAYTQKAYLYSLYLMCIEKIMEKTLIANKYIGDIIYLKNFLNFPGYGKIIKENCESFSKEFRESVIMISNFPKKETCTSCKKYIHKRFYSYTIDHTINMYVWMMMFCKKCLQERKYKCNKMKIDKCILSDAEKEEAYKIPISVFRLYSN